MSQIRFPTSGGDYVDDGECLRLACAAEALMPEPIPEAQAPEVVPEPVPAVPRKTGRKPLIRIDEE